MSYILSRLLLYFVLAAMIFVAWNLSSIDPSSTTQSAAHPLPNSKSIVVVDFPMSMNTPLAIGGIEFASCYNNGLVVATTIGRTGPVAVSCIADGHVQGTMYCMVTDDPGAAKEYPFPMIPIPAHGRGALCKGKVE